MIDLRLGDCLELMPLLNLSKRTALITDPPYGMKLQTNYKTRKRGALAGCNDFPPIVGDDKPFDPAPFLHFETIVMFGANWFAHKLPPSGAWLVWDKIDGMASKRDFGFNDNSDCELAWTNHGNAARIIRHRWMGAMKASEHQERRVHPTQKPVAVMREIIRNYTDAGDTIFDPFMGAGSTGIAATLEGRNFVGCEISPEYYAIAQRRIADAQQQLTLV